MKTDLNSSQRFLSLDVLKGAGIAYLIILHHIVWFFTQADGFGLLYQEAYTLCYLFGYKSGLHFFGFQVPMLAGAAFCLAVNKKNISYISVVKRAVYLALIGFLMNAFAWGIPYIFDWDVLGFIALSMIISYPLLKLNSRVSSFLLIGCVLLSFLYADKFPFELWHDFYLYKIILGDVNGLTYWPLIPWYALFGSGIFLGKAFLSGSKNSLKIVLAVGILSFIISVCSGRFFPTVSFDRIWGAALFKPSAYFLLGIMGLCLVSSSLLELIFERKPRIREFFSGSALEYWGKGILWIYVVHIVMGYHITVNFLINVLSINFLQALIGFCIMVFINLTVGYFIGKSVSSWKQKKKIDA